MNKFVVIRWELNNSNEKKKPEATDIYGPYDINAANVIANKINKAQDTAFAQIRPLQLFEEPS